MKKTSLRQWAVTIFLMIMAVVVQAAEVKFNIVPVLRAPNTMPANGLAYAQYMITNNTGIARELTTVPIPGVRHFVTGAPGTCHSPFVLAHGQSCLLVLELLAHEMAGGVHSGPVVCKTMGPGDNRPDASLCSQPYPTDFLQINLTPAIPVGLVANPSAVVFPFGSTGSVTITNTNPFGFAQHLDIHFILNTAISITSSTCPSHLPPNASCVITFSATSGATTTLSVMGTNTNQLLIPVTAAANVPISVSPNPLVLGVGNSSSVTVTNLSTTIPALNVHAVPPAASSNIQVSSTNCPASLPPGGSCTITFSATGVQSGITVPIQGTNTTSVNLAVSSQLVPITLSPTSLSFVINGSGTVTVTNASPTFNAYNIQPVIPGGTTITVTNNTCPQGNVPLPPQGTCTITFTSTLPTSPAGVNVAIRGTNTSSQVVKITVSLASIVISNPVPNTLNMAEGDTGTITIMNQTPFAAINIQPTLSQGITVAPGGNTCSPSLGAFGSCTITFTAPNNVVSGATIPISGTNTNTVQLTVNVTEASISIATSPPTSPPDARFYSRCAFYPKYHGDQ